MSNIEKIRPYVEKVLKDYCGTDKLIVRDNGDVPFDRGSTSYVVRLIDRTPPVVRVLAGVLTDIPKTPELLDKLNDITADLWFVKIYWWDSNVLAAQDLLAETLDKEELELACSYVGGVADEWDDQLKEAFGGNLTGKPPEPQGTAV